MVVLEKYCLQRCVLVCFAVLTYELLAFQMPPLEKFRIMYCNWSFMQLPADNGESIMVIRDEWPNFQDVAFKVKCMHEVRYIAAVLM